MSLIPTSARSCLDLDDILQPADAAELIRFLESDSYAVDRNVDEIWRSLVLRAIRGEQVAANVVPAATARLADRRLDVPSSAPVPVDATMWGIWSASARRLVTRQHGPLPAWPLLQRADAEAVITAMNSSWLGCLRPVPVLRAIWSTNHPGSGGNTVPILLTKQLHDWREPLTQLGLCPVLADVVVDDFWVPKDIGREVAQTCHRHERQVFLDDAS